MNNTIESINKSSVKRKSVIISSIVIVLFIFLCGFYLCYENTKLQISNYHIENKEIPNDFNNYKIVQVSDFHNTKSKSLTNDLIKAIENQQPNIIVITGDLIDSNKLDINVAVNFVAKINNIAPIYFVSGNHEASIESFSHLKEKLKENKVIILDNDFVALRKNESQINLIGVADPKMAHENYVSDSNIIKAELSSIMYDNSNYNILLSHRPELFDSYVEKELDLVLVGHAHGGQIRMPFIGGIVAPNQGLFPKYTAGRFENKGTTMIISRGIGNSILPFRINNRPELVVVTLNN